MQFFTLYHRIFFVRLVKTIGSTTIVSETNRKYMNNFRSARMPILAVSRLHLIDPSSIEHNDACYMMEDLVSC